MQRLTATQGSRDAADEPSQDWAALAVLACLVLAAIMNAIAWTWHRWATPDSTSNANIEKIQSSWLSVILLGAFQAVSLITFQQAVTVANFPDVLFSILAASTLLTIGQLHQQLALAKRWWQAALPEHALAALSILTYACKSPSSDSHLAQPFSPLAFILVAVHVIAARGAMVIKSSLLSSSSSSSDFEPNSPAPKLQLQARASTCASGLSVGFLLLFSIVKTSNPVYIKRSDLSILLVMSLSSAAADLASAYGTSTQERRLQSHMPAVSLVMNAVVFGYVRPMGSQAWLGVGWAVSSAVLASARESNQTLRDSAESEPFMTEKHLLSPTSIFIDQNIGDNSSVASTKPRASSRRPVLLASILPILAALAFAYIGHLSFPDSDQSDLQFPQASLSGESAMVEDGHWGAELHSRFNPQCNMTRPTERYERTHLHTALATFPRSGNSWTRSLVERAT